MGTFFWVPCSLIFSLALLFLQHIFFISWTLVIPSHAKNYLILILLPFSYILDTYLHFCRISPPEIVNNPSTILSHLFRCLSLREPTIPLSEILSICFHSPFELFFIYDLKPIGSNPSAEDSQHKTSALWHTYLSSLQQRDESWGSRCSLEFSLGWCLLQDTCPESVRTGTLKFPKML